MQRGRAWAAGDRTGASASLALPVDLVDLTGGHQEPEIVSPVFGSGGQITGTSHSSSLPPRIVPSNAKLSWSSNPLRENSRAGNISAIFSQTATGGEYQIGRAHV